MSDFLISSFNVSCLSQDEHSARIQRLALERRPTWVVTLNLEMIARASRSDEYTRLLRGADLVVADGMPIVWVSRVSKVGPAIDGRTNGTNMVDQILRTRHDIRVCIVGGADPRLVGEKYGREIPYLGGRIDPSSEADLAMVADFVEASGAGLVLLALGVPKQDRVAAYLMGRGTRAVVVGVGGALELLCGLKPRAPRWMQESGLEWLHRLLTEPGRLWKRYLLQYPYGVAAVVRQLVADSRAGATKPEDRKEVSL